MKTLILILGVVLATGCATNKCGITEPIVNTRIIYLIDSENSVGEDPNNPGTFYAIYDTIKIEVRNVSKRGVDKTIYKVLEVKSGSYLSN